MNKHAQALGRIKTEAKAQAARQNGRSGGRPAIYPACTASRHRFYKGQCRNCGIAKLSR